MALQTLKTRINELIATSHALKNHQHTFKTRPTPNPTAEYLVEKGYLKRIQLNCLAFTWPKEEKYPIGASNKPIYFYQRTKNTLSHKKLLAPLRLFPNTIDFQKRHDYRPTLPIKQG